MPHAIRVHQPGGPELLQWDEVTVGEAESTATTPMSKALTAYYLSPEEYPLRSAKSILFHAAAGGVGWIACQWARAPGVTMIGTVDPDKKSSIAKALGCTNTNVY